MNKNSKLEKFCGVPTLKYYKFTKFTIDLRKINKYCPLIVDILTTATDPIKNTTTLVENGNFFYKHSITSEQVYLVTKVIGQIKNYLSKKLKINKYKTCEFKKCEEHGY